MKRSLLPASLIGFALLLSACAPIITVTNRTDFPVRAVIVPPGGGRQVVSVLPGESSGVEYETPRGSYTAAVIPDQEWVEYAKLTRKVLNEQLANSDQLTGAQLLEVIRRLKDIAARMESYSHVTGGGACSGPVSEEGSNVVTITLGADGNLAASCG